MFVCVCPSGIWSCGLLGKAGLNLQGGSPVQEGEVEPDLGRLEVQPFPSPDPPYSPLSPPSTLNPLLHPSISLSLLTLCLLSFSPSIPCPRTFFFSPFPPPNPQPFSGPRCERVARSCWELQCPVGVPCQQTVRGPRCACPPGLSGPACRGSRGSPLGAANASCVTSPCLHGGSCRPETLAPFFRCACASGWAGPRCEIPAAVPEAPEEPSCPRAACEAKSGDKRCDRECNSPGCGWDGGDCSLSVSDPWRQCAALQCWLLFNNSRCDPACSSPACLYDNFDCRAGGRERTCK